MSAMAPTLLVTLIAILTAMLALWIVALVRRDASLADPFWGLGFLLVAWIAGWQNTPLQQRTLLMAILVTLWGLRLMLFLAWRNVGQGEDPRYVAMREHHGARFWWVSLFTVFLLQGLLMWLISLPVQAASTIRPAPRLGWLDGLGVAIWIVGFFFESVGDWQLARFKANPQSAGQIMDRGLWRYTRHPNYFGDFCIWWGIYLIATAGGAAWTIGSPLLMSLLLMRVSGVTLLESTITDRRPGYAAYRARTNAFFPGPPKSLGP